MIEPFSKIVVAKAYPALAAVIGNFGADRRSYIYARFKRDERRDGDIANYLRIFDQRAIDRGDRIVWICIEQTEEAA